MIKPFIRNVLVKYVNLLLFVRKSFKDEVLKVFKNCRRFLENIQVQSRALLNALVDPVFISPEKKTESFFKNLVTPAYSMFVYLENLFLRIRFYRDRF